VTLDATESLEFLSDVQPISKVKGKEHLMSSSATLSAPIAPPALDELCINTLRFLAVDMVQEANSGHPGLPMGSASMAYALWDRSLKFNRAIPIGRTGTDSSYQPDTGVRCCMHCSM